MVEIITSEPGFVGGKQMVNAVVLGMVVAAFVADVRSCVKWAGLEIQERARSATCIAQDRRKEARHGCLSMSNSNMSKDQREHHERERK
jgi:hypothetical protein